jgi:hypothetical protein
MSTLAVVSGFVGREWDETAGREGEIDDAPVPTAPRAPHGASDPLFPQAGIDLDAAG